MKYDTLEKWRIRLGRIRKVLFPIVTISCLVTGISGLFSIYAGIDLVDQNTRSVFTIITAILLTAFAVLAHTEMRIINKQMLWEVRSDGFQKTSSEN